MKGKRLQRIDLLLVEQQLAESRQRAQALILAGKVYVNGRLVDKAGSRVPAEAVLSVRGGQMPYVSRGGLKLEAALEHFHIDVSGLTCLDVGASTGGFTDCLLQHGASKVQCVDVGYGQFAWKLRQDPRVKLFERTNIRYLKADALPCRSCNYRCLLYFSSYCCAGCTEVSKTGWRHNGADKASV